MFGCAKKRRTLKFTRRFVSSSQWKHRRVTKNWVNTVVTMPIISVTAKPRTGPKPTP